MQIDMQTRREMVESNRSLGNSINMVRNAGKGSLCKMKACEHVYKEK